MLSQQPENIELALHFLTYAEPVADEELGDIVSRNGQLARCLTLKCRAIYPFIREAVIDDFSPELSEAIEFWGEFAQLKQLHRVSIFNCQHSDIWIAALAALPRLTALFIGQNKFVELPQGLQKLTQLRTFVLSDEPLRQLPELLLSFTTLEKLYILRCPLERLPDWLVKFQQLQSLLIHDTPLTELPMSIGFLPNLQSLSLTNNRLARLPSTIRQLQNLRYLYIDSNPISEQEKRQWLNALPNITII